ncbi:MAG: glycosyltransferase [Acidobacteriota bacterium]
MSAADFVPSEGASCPAASVIVLAYNAAPTIGRSLGALTRQDCSEEFEIIVVWSGEDDTAGIVSRDFPNVRLVGRPARLLTGATRNLGLAHARGEIIAFLAADCEVPEDWLSRRIAAHRAGFRCVGGAVVCAEPAGAVARASHLLEFIACSTRRPRAVVDQPLYNLSLHREVFARHGGYEETLACGEDTLFNWRLAHGHERFLFDPAIRTIHREPERLRELLQHQYWHGAWFGWLCRRHGTPGRDGTKRLGLWWILLWYPAGRLARLAWRVYCWQPKELPELVLLSPLLVLGVLSAALGLLRGWVGRHPDFADKASGGASRTPPDPR